MIFDERTWWRLSKERVVRNTNTKYKTTGFILSRAYINNNIISISWSYIEVIDSHYQCVFLSMCHMSLNIILYVNIITFVFWFIFVLCHVCPMWPVSLDPPFLIAPLVFSYVYFKWEKTTKLWTMFPWMNLYFMFSLMTSPPGYFGTSGKLTHLFPPILWMYF
jgi:hypothetical protein